MAFANTIVVHQDGSGDYTTIGGALAAAGTGDVIRIGIGTYSEFVTVTKSVTLESESGAAVTILDGLDTQRIIVVDGTVSVAIRGFTFKRAWADEASALFVWHQPTVFVEDCIFENNYATGSNAVAVRHEGSSLRLRNCLFTHNQAALHSAALSSNMGSSLVVENCQFIENQATGHAAMNTIGGHVEMTGCLFLRNVGSVGAATFDGSTGFVTGNTFHANSGPSGSVVLGTSVSFEKNIVSGDLRGYGLSTSEGTQHNCNLYFDNHLGASDQPLGSGELVGDPLYCEAQADVFLICSGSPALAAGQEGCGAMGAYGQGCECAPVSTEQTTWGALKGIFR
jgi:hypothetical protein